MFHYSLVRKKITDLDSLSLYLTNSFENWPRGSRDMQAQS